MKHYDVQTQLSDLLTSYIQHFKSILSTKLTLFQSLCLTNNSLQNNPQFLLSKFYNKKFKNDWPTDPLICMVGTDHISTLTRFYLRIQEYLQYRLGPLAAVNEGVFAREVMNFQRQLQKSIRKYQASLSESKSIGYLFALISQAEVSFTNQLIDKIKISKPSSVKGVVDFELINEMKEFFNKKINKEQNEGLKTINMVEQIQPGGRQLISNFVNNRQSLKIKNSIRKKTHSKRQTPISNLFNSVTPPPFNPIQKSIWCDKDTNLSQEEPNELQNYISQAQKQKLQAAYSLLQLQQTSRPIINKQDLLIQLQHRNLKNKIHISTYLNKYERKIRKRSMKQQAQKGSKSTAKSIKNSTPNYQQATEFLQKLQSFQMLTPIPKNHPESVKKGQSSLELPLIPRPNRRITQQK